jgi:hypothetical protein
MKKEGKENSLCPVGDGDIILILIITFIVYLSLRLL